MRTNCIAPLVGVFVFVFRLKINKFNWLEITFTVCVFYFSLCILDESVRILKSIYRGYRWELSRDYDCSAAQ